MREMGVLNSDLIPSKPKATDIARKYDQSKYFVQKFSMIPLYFE